MNNRDRFFVFLVAATCLLIFATGFTLGRQTTTPSSTIITKGTDIQGMVQIAQFVQSAYDTYDDAALRSRLMNGAEIEQIAILAYLQTRGNRLVRFTQDIEVVYNQNFDDRKPNITGPLSLASGAWLSPTVRDLAHYALTVSGHKPDPRSGP